MTYSQGSTHDRVAEINIIPLADVMLVLLIIFMIASPALTRRIVLDLPVGVPPIDRETKPPPPIRLRIDVAGQAYWNDSPTPTTALQAMMSTEVQRDPRNQPRLEIDANGDADYQAVTRVLAAAHNAEMSRIAFVRRD